MYLICGEALYDVFLDPVSPDNGLQVNLQAIPGGSPHNIAIGLARLGCAVALATEIAGDSLGRRLERRLKKEGVDCRFLRYTAATTPLAMVDIDESGAAHYVFHGLKGLLYHPDLSEVRKHWDALLGIHVGSVPIVSRQSAPHLLELVGSTPDRVLISFNPHVRLSLEPDVARWRKAVEEFRPHAHLIKVSEEDLLQLYGKTVDGDGAANRWLEHRCSLVVVTRGARGATLFTRQHGRIDIESAPVVVADTVGAGDSFQAAMLAWLAEHRRASPAELSQLSAGELAELGRFASHAAALTCRYRGPQFPYRRALK
jgi:fructokinase